MRNLLTFCVGSMLLGTLGIAPARAAEERPGPMVVVGFDGMDWGVLEALMAKGQLPTVAALRARGATARLITGYGAASPIVWTTVATGREMADHGINGFRMEGEEGASVPVASTMRKVPALWNIASNLNRRVLSLGWWGSWPAEKINGIVVSDRAVRTREHRVSPPEWDATFAIEMGEIDADRSVFPDNDEGGTGDRLIAGLFARHVANGYDLAIGYLHGIDYVSHKYWKYWEPSKFSSIDAASLAKHKETIPTKYREMDAALGKIVAAMPSTANIIVVSDHGFGPLESEFAKVGINLDRVLEGVGLLKYEGTSVDKARTLAYTTSSAPMQMVKWVRLAKPSPEAFDQLSTTLQKCTWPGGEPAFKISRPKKAKADRGDAAVEVLATGARSDLLCAGQAIPGAVTNLVEHSGGHSWEPPGVFIAAGPDIDPKADLSEIDIHDIAPTVLFGMGLPIADDFDGSAYEQLFTKAFRDRFPKRRIATYSSENTATPTQRNEADEEMLDELRALGYIE